MKWASPAVGPFWVQVQARASLDVEAGVEAVLGAVLGALAHLHRAGDLEGREGPGVDAESGGGTGRGSEEEPDSGSGVRGGGATTARGGRRSHGLVLILGRG